MYVDMMKFIGFEYVLFFGTINLQQITYPCLQPIRQSGACIRVPSKLRYISDAEN